MFRGANKVTLDAKGRLSMPTKYRDDIAARCANNLVATVDQDYCLIIYPKPDYEDIERKLARLPSLHPKVRKLTRLMIGYAEEVELDGHGRIRIPVALREFASLEKQAMLIGQINRFELWDEQRWNEVRSDWPNLDDDENDPPGLATLSL